MNMSNLTLGIVGVCLGFSLCYWLLKSSSSKSATKIKTPNNAEKTSAESVDIWCKDYIVAYRKKLLCFYVNSGIIEYAMELSSDDEKTLRDKYGHVYSFPFLFDIYMDYGSKFPETKEEILTESMRKWMKNNYPDVPCSSTGRELTDLITKMLEAEVKIEATEIMKEVISQNK